VPELPRDHAQEHGGDDQDSSHDQRGLGAALAATEGVPEKVGTPGQVDDSEDEGEPHRAKPATGGLGPFPVGRVRSRF